jgi:zinc transporter, ZIP family
MGVVDSSNVGVAFGMVCGAGAATALGAAVVFFPALAKHSTRRTLAAGLGLSAGVMTYVSFVEIFNKSVIAFTSANHPKDDAYVMATGCFFGGLVFMLVRTKEFYLLSFSLSHVHCCV